MKSVMSQFSNEHQKNIVRLFNKICYRHSRWSLWTDFIMLSAISISNMVDLSNAEHREETYRNLQSKYTEQEMKVISQMFSEVVLGLEENIKQDFLGELFMALEHRNLLYRSLW